MRIFGILRDLENTEPVQWYRTSLPLRALVGKPVLETRTVEVETVEIVDGIEVETIEEIETEVEVPTEIVFMDGFMAAEVLDNRMAEPSGDGVDVYTSCRMYLPGGKKTNFFDQIHAKGSIFVFDSDDDLTERYRLVSGNGEYFIRALETADYVTTSTPELAELFSEWTQKPPVVLPNHIDVDGFAETADEARRLYAGTAIGFSGSKTHWGDWYIASVPWARIIEDYPDTLPLLHGDPPGYLRFAKRPEVRAGCAYKHYPAILAQFDILLCGIDLTDPFSRGKSGIKAIECMCAGAVPVCSKLPAYQRLYDAGAPIVMIEEETRDCWYSTMRILVEDEELRRDLKSRGRAWVKANRDIATGYQLWLDAYQGMVSDER